MQNVQHFISGFCSLDEFALAFVSSDSLDSYCCQPASSNIHSHLYSRMRVCYSWKVQIPRWLACVWVLPGRYEVVPHLFSFHANHDSQRQITSGTWSILR